MTLRDRLIRWFKSRPGEVFAKGEIERIVMAHTTYTADNAARQLRKLAEEGTLKVTYKNNHAHYQWNSEQTDWSREEAIFDSL